MIVNPINLTIQDYWKEVRRIQRDLPGVVTLASIPEKMLACNLNEREHGSVHFIEADSFIAAQSLFAGTHRIATPEEIASQAVKRETNIRESVRAHLAKSGIVSIVLPEQSSSK
jgi:hypothetical protein